MGYKRETIKGVSWVGSFRILSRLIALLKTVILARVFSPTQFGVFGIASLVLAFLEIITETGINIFIVQTKQKIANFIDTAWVLSIIRGFVVGIIIYLLAPVIAGFFNSRESESIIVLISIVPVIRGFVNPSKNLLQKNLNFSKEFYLQGTLLLIDAFFAITFSIITQNITALVIGLIASAIFEVILTFSFIKPIPRLGISLKSVKQIFHKGKWVTWAGVSQYIAENADNISVGKFLGAGDLGIYQVAYRLSTLTITEITDVINRVFFPIYAKISNDKEKLKSVFIKSSLTLSLLVIPAGLIFFFFSREIIIILLGEKWLEAAGVLKVLAFYGILRSLIGYPSSLFLGLGLQKNVAYMTSVRGVVLLITVFPLLFAYGIIGVAYSAILSVVAEFPIVLYMLFKIFKRR